MEKLNDCYRNLAENTSRWSYYDYPPSISEKWSDKKEALHFIKDYFAYGGKDEVFKDGFLQKHERKIAERAPHIISTFLLGIKIAECFDINIDHRDETTNMDFRYYWFVTCFYHDFGYAFENNVCCDNLRSVSSDGIEALQEIYNLQYVHNRIFKTYPKEVVDFYLKCRASCIHHRTGVIDHGIVGGIMLYDKLRKQFAKVSYRLLQANMIILIQTTRLKWGLMNLNMRLTY